MVRASRHGAAIFFGLIAFAAPARATAFCEVKSTRDGFVALRAAPQVNARLLVRVPAGDDVQIDSARAARGGWSPVIYHGPLRDKRVIGWMRSNLIAQECG